MDINTSIPCNKGNYGSARNTANIKYIVLHWTANKTDTAKANATYFKNNVVKASAHYFVDDNSIYRSVPDNYVAWSVGGSKLNTGGGSMYKKITNANSLSVEMCCTNSEITLVTLSRALDLVVDLMRQYSVPLSNVYRHYDVTGKLCPRPYVDENTWTSVKNELTRRYTNTPIRTYDIAEPVLKKGSKGVEVKKLQNQLNYFCNANLKVDGSFGNGTKQALMNVQSFWNLSVDGVYGPKTKDVFAFVCACNGFTAI